MLLKLHAREALLLNWRIGAPMKSICLFVQLEMSV